MLEGRKGSGVVEALLRVLGGNSDDYTRAAAARLLGRTGAPEAVPPLIEALRRGLGDSNKGVACDAAVALGNLGERDVIPLLRLLVNRSTGYAVEALGRLGEEGAEALLSAVEEGHSPEYAAAPLGQTRSPRAFHLLMKWLDHSRWEVRRAAAEGLGYLEDPRAIPRLVRAVEDEEWAAAGAAAWAIERLTGEDFGEVHPRFGFRASDLERIRAAVRAWAARR